MISSPLHGALARARLDDLRRTATAQGVTRRYGEPERLGGAERSVTLRFCSSSDEKALARLAALDSSRAPVQPVLLAEVDGQLLAALALSDGTVVADPFHRTADLIDLLRARAHQLGGVRQAGRFPRSRRWSRLRAVLG